MRNSRLGMYICSWAIVGVVLSACSLVTKKPISQTVVTPVPSVQPSPSGIWVGGTKMTPDKDIISNLQGSKYHTTFMSALETTNVVATLRGTGSFTVFAPTDTAFMQLSTGAVTQLFKPVNRAKLIGLTTYHIVPGSYQMSDLKDGQTLSTVEGETLVISIKDQRMMVNGADVTTPDVVSKNGIIFVIDTVLLPTGKLMTQ